MDVQQSQSGYFDAFPVDSHTLNRRMAEVLDLRAKVASLEKVRSETQRSEKANDLSLVDRRA